MKDAILLFATAAIATLGFACLAFSQRPHWRSIARPDRTQPPAPLRFAGSALIALAALPAIMRDGPAFGLLLWVTILSFSALAAILLVTTQAGRAGSPTGAHSKPKSTGPPATIDTEHDG